MSTRSKPAVEHRLVEYRRKRDFSKTAEPSGSAGRSGGAPHQLRFVIQKHAASHLHFDFRLELDGVMKSWAVPKGPSLDPKVKRLAMEVEDHPIEYNTFEGTIPKGQYGGGTVMLWDRGTYTADSPSGNPVEALRRGYEKGELKFVLDGERLHGSWVLVRTRRSGSNQQWLLIKHNDEYAEPGSDIVAEVTTSVATGRTMEEIAGGAGAVWNSNRGTRDWGGRPLAGGWTRQRLVGRAAHRHEPRRVHPPRGHPPQSRVPKTLEPMYASIGAEAPAEEGWTFEPKYDGIRVLAFATAKAVKLVTRNGKDKAKQFPEVVEALRKLAAQSRRALVLDGEIVALRDGAPARFQELQRRMHVKDAAAIAELADETPAALVAFDLLRDGDDVLLNEPWSVRRKRLEQRLRRRTSPRLRLGESAPGDGREMLDKARAEGWEGIIAKRMDSYYEPGKRSGDWLKLKVEYRQEFVVGGYTEPRNTREYIGALLLGYFDGDRLVYVGSMGGGFDRAGLKQMYHRLKPLERRTSPFDKAPRTREPTHWVRPEVVVEVKFSEWTGDGRLRQPIYLGTREDKSAREVGREPRSVQEKRGTRKRRGSVRRAVHTTAARAKSERRASNPESTRPSPESLIDQLAAIEEEGGEGTLRIARGRTLDVSSLDKVFFPGEGYTKGDVMRYYARVAPALLPAIKGRPLVLKRSPDGIKGETFFQQKAPEHAPRIVRVETVESDEGEAQERVVGSDIATLLYTVQLGCISVDPWHSRVGSLDAADYTVLDLDPGPRAPFGRVVEVARWVQEELEALSLHGALKTSGSRGLHIVLPLPARTSYDVALLLAQLVATRVAKAHPREATVERSLSARPPTTVYVDYLQNAKGKSLAAAYCVRAKPGATVSTPLNWEELTTDLDPHAFTIETAPARLAKLGDIWSSALKRKNTSRAIRAAANQ